MPGVESRQALEAWRALRGLGIDPGDHAKDVLGVVIEIALDLGTDTIAAYADGTARYYNQGGAAVVFEGDDAGVNGLVHGVLDAARITVTAIGPWPGALPFQPRKGEARMTILTPSGLHFGESTRSALMGDRTAAPVISAALALMKRFMLMVQQPRDSTSRKWRVT